MVGHFVLIADLRAVMFRPAANRRFLLIFCSSINISHNESHVFLYVILHALKQQYSLPGLNSQETAIYLVVAQQH